VSFKLDAGGIRELGASTELRNFMDQIGQDSRAAVKDLAPVGETKKLRDGVDYKLDREDGTWMVHVFFDQFYGMFHEFPTSRGPGKSFLRAGVLKVIGRLGGRLGDTGPG
jgi:hypothetical protein